MNTKEIIQKGLEELGINSSIISRYDEPHRYYHNWSHIEDLFQRGMAEGYVGEPLMLAIVFHDIVYNPKLANNEELSAKLFSEVYNGHFKEQVTQAILDTKAHTPSNPVSESLCRLDLSILQSDFKTLLEYENKIFKEFQFVDWRTYQTERIKVLRKLQKKDELENLIAYVETRQPNIAVYAGSFNPMHKGHLNILQKAEAIFDKVIIARGINPEKKLPEFAMTETIQFRQFKEYKGLLTDFIERLEYPVTLIRGLRNATDLQYEVTQLRYMQDMKTDLKVVSFVCDKEFEHISSSAIRQLYAMGQEKITEKYRA